MTETKLTVNRKTTPLRHISLVINRKEYRADVEPRLLLVHFIRDVADLNGTHIGCDTSNCGACTVLLNGKSVKSCTMFAVQADGGEVLTVESLAKGGELHPIQKAFWDHHAQQCGFCTPGMIMQEYWLLKEFPNPSEEQIRMGISGNLCRCTGYQNIVDAVKAASRTMRSK